MRPRRPVGVQRFADPPRSHARQNDQMLSTDSSIDAITMFVADPQRSKTFYGAAFGVEPIHEDDDSVAFRLQNIVVNLLALPAAAELITPATPSATEDAHRFQLTVPVQNVDDTCRDLATNGIELLNGPLDRPWGVRTAAFADPDGHIWEIAHNLG